MIALLADEDFNARITRGLVRRVPGLDIIPASHAQLAGRPDAEVAEWAALEGRVLMTHDVNTMVLAAIERIEAGRPMPGLIAVPQDVGIGLAISDLEIIVSCAEPGDLVNQIVYLPL